MAKTLAILAVALGLLGATAGSAFAEGGCGSSSSQSVSLESQTASTAPSGGTPPSTPQPGTGSN